MPMLLVGIALYSFHKYQKEMQTPSPHQEDNEAMAMAEHMRSSSPSDGHGTHHIIGDEDDAIDGDGLFSSNGHARAGSLGADPGKRPIRESVEHLRDMNEDADLLGDGESPRRLRSQETSPHAYKGDP